MFLTVVHTASGERRWYEAPARGTVTVGSAVEGDITIAGHNITLRHVQLRFENKRVVIDVLHPRGVRVDGREARGDSRLEAATRLAIGPWEIRREPQPPTGIEPVDEAFCGALASPDDRAVYADSLEDRGRIAEAELIRTGIPSPGLAVQTPPAWRRRFLPVSVENCAVAECSRAWKPRCATCDRALPIFGHIGAALAHAQKGNPVALDPAVIRWRDDLRIRIVRRPAIEMGQPTPR